MKVPDSIQLIELKDNGGLISEVKLLIAEYGRYMYEELDLIAGKESFFKDLENFPAAAYHPPAGTFFVVTVNNEVAGCAGVRKFDDSRCEMKRMYTRPAYRGKGIGSLLCNAVIDWGRKATYSSMLLDTNAAMRGAVILYHTCGFVEIPAYCVNENDHPIFMERIL